MRIRPLRDPRDPDGLVGSWSATGRPLSEHLRLELATVAWTGRPLPPGSPVPGCGCPSCTGISADAPARARRRPRRDLRPPLGVDRARAVSILDVARSLGLEVRTAPNGDGWTRCPFHDDQHPSLHLNPRKGRAFCNPCGRSWDAIGLVMEMRRYTFPEAVRELAL